MNKIQIEVIQSLILALVSIIVITPLFWKLAQRYGQKSFWKALILSTIVHSVFHAGNLVWYKLFVPTTTAGTIIILEWGFWVIAYVPISWLALLLIYNESIKKTMKLTLLWVVTNVVFRYVVMVLALLVSGLFGLLPYT